MKFHHIIWLYNTPSLEIIDNMLNIGNMFANSINDTEAFCPILWTDHAAISKIQSDYSQDGSPFTIKIVNLMSIDNQAVFHKVFKVFTSTISNKFAPPGNDELNLYGIEFTTTNHTMQEQEIIYLPIFIWEDMSKLIKNILDIPLLDAIKTLCAEYKEKQFFIPENFSPIDKLIEVINYCKNYIVVCASDLVRLLALLMFGGMYTDVNDIKLKNLPRISEFPAANFMYRQVIDDGKIINENDVLYSDGGFAASMVIFKILATNILNAIRYSSPDKIYYNAVCEALKNYNSNIIFCSTSDKTLMKYSKLFNSSPTRNEQEIIREFRNNMINNFNDFYQLLINNKDIIQRLETLFSNNCLEHFIGKSQLQRDIFYKAYQVDVFFIMAMSYLVSSFSFATYSHELEDITLFHPDCSTKLVTSALKFIEHESLSVKKHYSWQNPGFSLIKHIKYLNSIIENKEHKYRKLAILSMMAIRKKYPPHKYNDYYILKTVDEAVIDEHVTAQKGKIISSSDKNYIIVSLIEKYLKEEIRAVLQIDKVKFIEGKPEIFKEKIKTIQEKFPTVTVDMLDDSKTCYLTFPNENNNRGKIKEIIDSSNIVKLQELSYNPVKIRHCP